MTEKETQTVEETVEAVQNEQDMTAETEEAEVIDERSAAEVEMAELNAKILRIQADYDNFRRRSREEREAAAKYRSQHVVEALLPVVDNFERALLVKPESEEAKSLLKGMEMVYRQFQETLKNEGVEVIETVGQTFDPHFHQAVMQVEEEGFESNQIVEELQKGYKLKDRILRPSMVKVNA
ncbi:heat shock protein GrpE [Halalkalibacter akibai JCM 9157]|uniref:Protein GrpE n=1 Tax=Halalkalibacter akibai (strain ATCC 43226 / DSM 21942 / CIP 109018 / JCM 9157 / 1139) TaxID=1236973 RepID=W4QPT1_HALA3|nr:nucleotide exchange factor GrpE [Halalkalibacter akibai]GAE33354.1 heat shock protein GrpE [Halalkalibacter akibai JCM 9157]